MFKVQQVHAETIMTSECQYICHSEVKMIHTRSIFLNPFFTVSKLLVIMTRATVCKVIIAFDLGFYIDFKNTRKERKASES